MAKKIIVVATILYVPPAGTELAKIIQEFLSETTKSTNG